MTSVTDADREIAGQVLGECVLGNDERANKIIARYRQAAMIEGARLYQLHCMYTWMDDDEDYQGCDFADWVEKTGPTAIVKGKSDGVD